MNAKIYTGDIQPNAKEYKIWIDSKGSIKTYDTTQGTWSEVRGGASNTQPAPAEKITFVVVDGAGTETTYTAEKGMTWKQFGTSQYNVDAWVIIPEGFSDDFVYINYYDDGLWSGESYALTYLPPNSGVGIGSVENAVNANDFIVANHRYGKEYDSWGVGGGGVA